MQVLIIPGVIDRIVNAIVRMYRPIILVFVAIALISLGLLIKPGLREDYRIESMVAANDEEYHRYRRFGDSFVSGEMAMIVIDAGDPLEPNNLELTHWISQECRGIEGVESPLTITELPQLGLWAMFTSGGRHVQTVYERLRQDPSARGRIEAELRNNPIVVANLMGQDARTGKPTNTTGILVQVAGESSPRLRKLVVEKLRRVVENARRMRPDAIILLGGPLIGLMEIFEAIHRDLVVFSIVVFILIGVALWLITRRAATLLATLAAAGVSTLCILGFSILCDMSMSLVSQTIVILVVVQAVSMCIHLFVAHEETRLHLDGPVVGPLEDARRTLHRTFVPCFMAALTTFFGFGSLLVSDLLPIRYLSVLGSAGVALAIFLGLAAVPALCRFSARKAPVRHDLGRLNEGLARIARLASRGGIGPISLGFVFAVLVGLCAVKVPAALRNFENDFVKNFRENSNVRRVYRFVEQNLGPVGSIEVVVRRKDGGPVIGESAMLAIDALRRSPIGHASVDPDELQARIAKLLTISPREVLAGVELMQRAGEFQDRVEQELNPPIRKTLSLADLVKLASVGRMLGLSTLQLPLFESQFVLTMALIDQKMSHELLRHFITTDGKAIDGKAIRINLRATESDDVYRKLDVTQRVRQTAHRVFGGDYAVEVTGLYPLYAKITVDLLQCQLRSFMIALLLIGGSMCVALRSVRLGLIGMIPNVVPIILCLGVMGWTGIPINMATAMMLSIALGIAVDNTIHYLWRFRRELSVDGDCAAAIVRSHRSVGIACTFNTIVIVGGFWVLCLSEFVPTIYFGLLIGLTMLVALASVIFLLPMLLMLVRPASPRTSAG